MHERSRICRFAHAKLVTFKLYFSLIKKKSWGFRYIICGRALETMNLLTTALAQGMEAAEKGSKEIQANANADSQVNKVSQHQKTQCIDV